MQLSARQKKTVLILGGSILLIIVLLVAGRFTGFLGARLVPGLSESIVGGRIKASAVQNGTNELEFTAITEDGRVVSDSVTFEVLVPGS